MKISEHTGFHEAEQYSFSGRVYYPCLVAFGLFNELKQDGKRPCGVVFGTKKEGIQLLYPRFGTGQEGKRPCGVVFGTVGCDEPSVYRR